MRTKFTAVQFICYYNMALGAVGLIGAVSITVFALVVKPPEWDSLFSPGILSSMFLYLCLSGLYIYAGKKYLRKSRIGRTLLMVCCVTQIITALWELVSNNLSLFSLAPKHILLTIVVLLVGSWGIWYLNTSNAKKWIETII